MKKLCENATDFAVTEMPNSFGSVPLNFSLEKEPLKGLRLGKLGRGEQILETPAFLPVGTLGGLKTLSVADLDSLQFPLVLANTYHLMVRPGLDLLKKIGGLKAFNGWKKLLLTDSGGFQVMSLASIRRVREEGVEVANHLNGAPLFLTPESVVDAQRIIGSDLQMVLDQCVSYDTKESQVREALDRTHRWAKRAREHHLKTKSPFAQLGIVQGGFRLDWREESVDVLKDLEFDAYAIGGVSVGEPREHYRETVARTAPLLPTNRLRYVMGVGRPADLFFAVLNGVDVFDCVMPTRQARNGTCFVRRNVTEDGILRLKRAEYQDDFRPLDEHCSCWTCRHTTRAYLRHLFKCQDPTALRLLSLHNLQFFWDLFSDLRHILSTTEGSDLLEALVKFDHTYSGLEKEFNWKNSLDFS